MSTTMQLWRDGSGRASIFLVFDHGARILPGTASDIKLIWSELPEQDAQFNEILEELG